MIKKLIWLIKNQEKIQKLLEKPVKNEKDENFSIAGVPDFQKDYVSDLLNGNLKDNRRR